MNLKNYGPSRAFAFRLKLKRFYKNVAHKHTNYRKLTDVRNFRSLNFRSAPTNNSVNSAEGLTFTYNGLLNLHRL